LDDLCVGGGHCIHGDGEEICPECYGEGEDDEDDRDDGTFDGIAEGYAQAALDAAGEQEWAEHERMQLAEQEAHGG